MRKSLLTPTKSLPSAQEVAARPDLVKELLKSVNENVYEHDLEYVVVIGITPSGDHKIYHSYGRDLPTNEVASLLTDLAAMARKAGRKAK